MRLIDLFNSNPIGAGALVVGSLSGLIALCSFKAKSQRVRWWIFYGIPIGLAYTLAWSQIWEHGKNSLGESTFGWDQIIILMWATAGIVAARIVIDYKQGRFKKSY